MGQFAAFSVLPPDSYRDTPWASLTPSVFAEPSKQPSLALEEQSAFGVYTFLEAKPART